MALIWKRGQPRGHGTRVLSRVDEWGEWLAFVRGVA